MVRSNPISHLNWTYVLVGIADGSLLTFIPLLLFERGLSAAQIGVVLAAAAAVSLVAGLVWGYLVDRGLHAERMLVLASACAVTVALMLALTGGGVGLALVVVALYVARSPLMLLDPIALRRLRTARRTDYARIRLRMSAGWAGSVVLSGGAFQALSLRLLPFVYAPLAAIVGLWVWRFIKPVEVTPVAGDAIAHPAPMNARLPLAMVSFLLSLFLLGAALSATQNFLTVQIDILGGGAFLIGAASAFQALTEIPTMGYTHVLSRFASQKVLFAIGCAIYVVIFIAWACGSAPQAGGRGRVCAHLCGGGRDHRGAFASASARHEPGAHEVGHVRPGTDIRRSCRRLPVQRRRPARHVPDLYGAHARRRSGRPDRGPDT